MMITELLVGLNLTTKIVAGVSAVAITGAAAGAAGVLPSETEAALDATPEIAVDADVSGDAEMSDDAGASVAAEASVEAGQSGRTDGSFGPAAEASGVVHEAAEFGTSMAEDARDGDVDGGTVAADARAQAEGRSEAGAEGSDPSVDAQTEAEARATAGAEIAIENVTAAPIHAVGQGSGEAGLGIGVSGRQHSK